MAEVNFPSEKAIEDYVFEQISDTGLCPVSDEHVSHVFRQYEIAGYGIADVVKVQVMPEAVVITILELKNENLKEAHLSQLSRYMIGLKRQLRRYMRRSRKHFVIEVLGELAGPFEASTDFVFLLDQLESISVYSLSLSMKSGFRSEWVSDGWHKKGENLKGAQNLARAIWPAICDAQTPPSNVVQLAGEGHGESA